MIRVSFSLVLGKEILRFCLFISGEGALAGWVAHAQVRVSCRFERKEPNVWRVGRLKHVSGSPPTAPSRGGNVIAKMWLPRGDLP